MKVSKDKRRELKHKLMLDENDHLDGLVLSMLSRLALDTYDAKLKAAIAIVIADIKKNGISSLPWDA